MAKLPTSTPDDEARRARWVPAPAAGRCGFCATEYEQGDLVRPVTDPPDGRVVPLCCGEDE